MAEETPEMAEETKLKTHTCVRLYQDIVKARTNDEFQAAIHDAAPVNYDSNPPLAPAGAPSTLERVVIRPGESGGLLTRSEFELAKLCTEERLRKKTSDRIIRMIKLCAFIIEDIHADSRLWIVVRAKT